MEVLEGKTNEEKEDLLSQYAAKLVVFLASIPEKSWNPIFGNFKWWDATVIISLLRMQLEDEKSIGVSSIQTVESLSSMSKDLKNKYQQEQEARHERIKKLKEDEKEEKELKIENQKQALMMMSDFVSSFKDAVSPMAMRSGISSSSSAASTLSFDSPDAFQTLKEEFHDFKQTTIQNQNQNQLIHQEILSSLKELKK